MKYEEKKERSESAKLKKQVRELSSENRRLKSELNTLMEAWHKTEIYLKDLNGNKTLSEVLKNVKSNNKFEQTKCPECGSDDFRMITMKEKVIRTCKTCNYRETLNVRYEEHE